MGMPGKAETPEDPFVSPKVSGSSRNDLLADAFLRLLCDDLPRNSEIKREGRNVVLVNPVGAPRSSRIDRGALLHIAGVAGDHLRAMMNNPRQPEGQTEDAARRLHEKARAWWMRMAARFAKHSLQKIGSKSTGQARQRLRFGAYLFADQTPQSPRIE